MDIEGQGEAVYCSRGKSITHGQKHGDSISPSNYKGPLAFMEAEAGAARGEGVSLEHVDGAATMYLKAQQTQTLQVSEAERREP